MSKNLLRYANIERLDTLLLAKLLNYKNPLDANPAQVR